MHSGNGSEFASERKERQQKSIFGIVSGRLGKLKKSQPQRNEAESETEKLPEDFLVDSFQWLNETDICLSTSLVCKSWYFACCSAFIWRPLYDSRFLTDMEDNRLATNPKQAYLERLLHPQPGDELEVAWHGKFRLENQSTFYGLSWWEATIVEADLEDPGNPRYKVHYPGWNARWDEWVLPSRLRWPLPRSATAGLRQQPGAQPLEFEEREFGTMSDKGVRWGRFLRRSQSTRSRTQTAGSATGSIPRDFSDAVSYSSTRHQSFSYPAGWQSDPFTELEDVGPGNILRRKSDSAGPLEFSEWLSFYDQRSALSKKWALFGRDSTGARGLNSSMHGWRRKKMPQNLRDGYVVEVWCTGTRVKGAWLEARICAIDYDHVRVRDFAEKSQVFWTSWCNVHPVRTRVITGEQVERKDLASPNSSTRQSTFRRALSMGRDLPSTPRMICERTSSRCLIS